MRDILNFLQICLLRESTALLLPIKRISFNSNIIHPVVLKQAGSLPLSQTHRFSTRSHPSFEVYSTDSDDVGNEKSYRSKMRKLTGFSLTASRKAIRASTGLSLSALRTTLRAATGISVSGRMKWILGLFPLWLRYFIQPFLILYYAPLLLLRGMVGQTKNSRLRARKAHEQLIEEWKNAVDVAESVADDGYWPVRINDQGALKVVLPPDPETILGKKIIPDIVDAVVESIEVADTITQSNES